ncbi:hypothetical protein [Halorientalis salina]|uniref:hypothetical protein n=1 Tax=Halorientalis salina TaxID=2932266 RepID=UPI0010AC9154|nr:hypothetical protein [Halorientalis salina]
MSTRNRFSLRGLSARGSAIGRLVGRAVFGDRRGLALFLGGLCFFGLYWRIGVFITDTNAIANTLVNVADGHLYITEAPYGGGREAPGTYRADGRAYGRNYGIVFFALPVLWAFEALATVLAPSVVVFALWSLVLVGFATTVGRLLDRDWIVVGGSGLAVVAFLTNLGVATPLAESLYPIFALQVVTLLATALTGVVLYRLVAELYDARVGLMAGAATVLGTPVAFWASIPKRHSFTALLLVTVVYALYRSRRRTDHSASFRALAYAAVGIMAWIHAAEALLLFVPLVAIDVATAPSNDRRTLGLVALAFLVSLLPFFLTNLLVSGNPVQPPRMLTPFDQAPGDLDLSGGGGGGIPIPVVGTGVDIALTFGSLLWDGVVVSVTEPIRLYQTFIRSGFLSGVASGDGLEAINLTMLESAPLVGGLLGIPLAIAHSLRGETTTRLRRHVRTPVGATDCYVLACAILFSLLYVPKLPIHAQVTVRYLHPLFPLSIYALVRVPAVRGALDVHWPTALWTFAGTVFVGSQLVVAYLGLTNPGLGEAVQFHALLAIATGTLLGLWVVARSLSTTVPDRAGAIALGLTTGVGTVFTLLSGLVYFASAGGFALPAMGVLSEFLALV